MSTISVSGYCLLLKNQECKVRKVIIDNDYLTFPYKLELTGVLEVVMIKIILILKFVYLVSVVVY